MFKLHKSQKASKWKQMQFVYFVLLQKKYSTSLNHSSAPFITVSLDQFLWMWKLIWLILQLLKEGIGTAGVFAT